jgi:hypothetical protein
MQYYINKFKVFSIVFICTLSYYLIDLVSYKINYNTIVFLFVCVIIFFIPFLILNFFLKRNSNNFQIIYLNKYLCYLFVFISLFYYYIQADYSVNTIFNELLKHRGYRIWDRKYVNSSFSIYYYMSHFCTIVSIFELTKRILLSNDNKIIFLLNIIFLMLLLTFFSLEGNRVTVYVPLIAVMLNLILLINLDSKLRIFKKIFFVLVILDLSN